MKTSLLYNSYITIEVNLPLHIVIYVEHILVLKICQSRFIESRERKAGITRSFRCWRLAKSTRTRVSYF